MTTAASDEDPTPHFQARRLVTTTIAVGRTWRRIYDDAHPDPLGYGSRPSRFSDPTGAAFGLVYGGESAKVAFVEAILRDLAIGTGGDFPLELTALTTKILATLEVIEPLTVIDLTGDGLVKMRIPTDIAHRRDHRLARRWGQAIHDHVDEVDGILFASRLIGHQNIAIYDRALHKLKGAATPHLMDCRGEVAAIFDDLELALVP